MFEIKLSPQAHKFYLSVEDKLASRLNIAFEDLINQPYFGKNIKKLRGSLEGLFRYRVGNYRIVYSIENDIKIISVVWIGKRDKAY